VGQLEYAYVKSASSQPFPQLFFSIYYASDARLQHFVSANMSFPKLTILITGSNQGLGYETARQLSKHPHIHLFLSGRNAERVQQALESISKEDGCKAVLDSVIIDVGDDDSIKAAVKEVEAKLGDAALDVLVVGSALARMIQ
jgi:NAD(P)-dependent dehydrogenase (short-subunit alcohol dehydrogenase family)